MSELMIFDWPLFLTLFGLALFLTLFGFFIGIGITITNVKELNKKCNSLEEANASLVKMHSKLFDDVSILRGDLNEKINQHKDVINMSAHNIANIQAKLNEHTDAINKLARHTEYPKSKIV